MSKRKALRPSAQPQSSAKPLVTSLSPQEAVDLQRTLGQNAFLNHTLCRLFKSFHYKGRDIPGIQSIFSNFGLNFSQYLHSLISAGGQEDDRVFRIVDFGCGPYGAAIEDLARHLLQQIRREQWRCKIEAIGIDLALDPDSMPEELWEQITPLDEKDLEGLTPARQESFAFQQGTRKRVAKLLQGDVMNPPLEKGSADFIYSLATLMYVGDPLRALERVYQLLDSTGEAFFTDAGDDTVSVEPPFEKILKTTFAHTLRSQWPINRYDAIRESGSMVHLKRRGAIAFTGFTRFRLGAVLNDDRYVRYVERHGMLAPGGDRSRHAKYAFYKRAF